MCMQLHMCDYTAKHTFLPYVYNDTFVTTEVKHMFLPCVCNDICVTLQRNTHFCHVCMVMYRQYARMI